MTIMDEVNAEIGHKNYLQWCAGVNELYKLFECDQVKRIAEYSVHHYRIFMTDGRAFDFYPATYTFGDLKNGKYFPIHRNTLFHTIQMLYSK